MRKALIGFFAGGLLLVAAPAQALTYNEIAPGQVLVSATQLTPGLPVTLQVCCFPAGSLVTFTIHSDPIVLGTAIADAQGVATGTFVVPLGLPIGTHHIEAAGVDSNGSPVSFSTGNLAQPGPSTPAAAAPLPRTGSSETVPVAATGAGLVIAGSGLVAVAKRRRFQPISI